MAITIRRPTLAVTDVSAPISQRSFIHALVFGPSGMGKTPYAAQWPKPLFLMADRNGENSLLRTNTPFVEIRNIEDFDEALEFLRREENNPDREYETIVLDTVSVFQSHVITDMCERLGIKTLRKQDWGEVGNEVRTRLARLKNLKYNIVISCHVKESGVKEGAYMSNLQGSLKDDIGAEFPFIIGLDRERIMLGAGEAAKPQDVLFAYFRPTALYPMSRTIDEALPLRLPVTFTPQDYQNIVDHLAAKAAEIQAANVSTIAPKQPSAAPAPQAAPASSQTPASDISGPASLQAPDSVERLAKRGAKAKATEEQAAAEPTLEESVDSHQEAVAVAAEAVGGTEISLEERVRSAKSRAEAIVLYNENQSVWTDELTNILKERTANEPGFAG